MSESLVRPRTLRGAFLVYDGQSALTAPPRRLIVFHYNPEQLRRAFTTRSPQPESGTIRQARQSALSVAGPPIETITMTIVLNAADQAEDPTQVPAIAAAGLHPTLAALELLLYPETALVARIDAQAARGQVQVTPSDTPLVVLVWGVHRQVPVQITTFSVAEEHFDARLNPVHAKVELTLKVLTYVEFPQTGRARETFLAHQRQKELLARAVVT